jgi:hypothetical protein
MKKILLISLVLFCTSCFIHKGQRINGQCRPKNPTFKLLKISFKEIDKLTFNRVYIADNFTKAVGYRFYSDGRLIFIHSKDGFALKPDDVINKKWNNAQAIGYWRIEGDKIKTEYFSCSNSGDYIREQGEIKGDTIIFERDCGTSNPFKTVKCPEKYILSDMSFE